MHPTEQLAKKLERESGKRLSDYPYDRTARVELLEGLEKLRAVDNPFREQLWALYWLAEAREVNGEAAAQRREEKAQKDRSERERLLHFADACLSGRRGAGAQEIARTFLFDGGGQRREDLASLKAVRDEVARAQRRAS